MDQMKPITHDYAKLSIVADNIAKLIAGVSAGRQQGGQNPRQPVHPDKGGALGLGWGLGWRWGCLDRGSGSGWG